MNWEIRSCLALPALFAASLSAADLSPTITVLMYNYAPIPSDVLAKTEAKAASIYQHCGIRIRWVNSPLSAGRTGQLSDAELSPGPTLLALRMLSRPMVERVRRAQDTVGFVLSPEDGSFATVADVFARHVEQLAYSRGIPERILLGYVVTHELGHLLLGPGSHGTTGIMCCPWRVKELDNIARGFMMFTPDEAERMRTNIRTRMSKSETGGAHTSNHSFHNGAMNIVIVFRATTERLSTPSFAPVVRPRLEPRPSAYSTFRGELSDDRSFQGSGGGIHAPLRRGLPVSVRGWRAVAAAGNRNRTEELKRRLI